MILVPFFDLKFLTELLEVVQELQIGGTRARAEPAMPIAIVLFLVDVTLVVHAAKTGRFSPWAYLILLLPGVGALAYVLVELLPEWFGSVQGQKTRQHFINTLDPEKQYRKFADDLAITDTIANRVHLAEECLLLGKFEEALAHYENALSRPMGDEPNYALGKAKAEFGLRRPQDAVATLDLLRQRWPDYQSADGHLLYARALEESGREAEALDEYRVLVDYYPGAEARVRFAMLLQQMGRAEEAKRLCADVLTQMRRAPKYVRKVQAEWIAAAERMLRA
jgi:hypothetical protein